MNRSTLAMAGAAAVLLAVWWTSAQSDRRGTLDIELWAGDTTVRATGVADLSPEVGEIYANWRRRVRYFGAFAVSPQGDHGRTGSYNDQTIADAQALIFCGRPECTIIARARPDLPPRDVRVIPLETMQNLTDLKADEGRKAFAIHPNGAWGSHHGAPSIAFAREEALKHCRYWATTGDGVAPDNARPDDCEVLYAAPE